MGILFTRIVASMSPASDKTEGKQEERDTDAGGPLAFNTAEWREALDSVGKGGDAVQLTKVVSAYKRRLHISNMDYAVHENLLAKFLSSKFGVRVTHCKIIRNAFNNESKGYGFVEFESEADAEKIFDAYLRSKYCFKLKTRLIKVAHYQPPRKSDDKHSTIKTPGLTTKLSTGRFVQNGTKQCGITIDDLPNDMLFNIFARLPLENLFALEKVCKRWKNVASLVWSSCRRVSIRSLRTAAADTKAFMLNRETTVSNVEEFRMLLSRCSRLIELSLVKYKLVASSQIRQFLAIIEELCPNLTHLNLSGILFSNLSFVHLIKKCRKLKHVRLLGCFKISDASIVKLFKNCRDLESLDVSACFNISDTCFQTLRSKHRHIRLKYLSVYGCYKITDETLDALCHSSTAESLQTLKIIGFRKITYSGICQAVKSLSALDLLEYDEEEEILLELKEALTHSLQNHAVSIRKNFFQKANPIVTMTVVRRNSSSISSTVQQAATTTTKRFTGRTYRMRISAEADEANTLAKRKAAKRSTYGNVYRFWSYISNYVYGYASDRGKEPDYTACDSECGYCGRCDY